eukprot:SAG11_NODE_599_length_8269_cov_3.455080_4_plen_169_part_00
MIGPIQAGRNDQAPDRNMRHAASMGTGLEHAWMPHAAMQPCAGECRTWVRWEASIVQEEVLDKHATLIVARVLWPKYRRHRLLQLKQSTLSRPCADARTSHGAFVVPIRATRVAICGDHCVAGLDAKQRCFAHLIEDHHGRRGGDHLGQAREVEARIQAHRRVWSGWL